MRNPLALPLIIVSVVAGIEAVALVMLVSRDRIAAPAPTIVTQSTGAALPPSTPAEASAPPPATQPPGAAEAGGAARAAAGVAAGKKGQRVESAGFAITVEQITDEPTHPNLLTLGPDQRYLALLLVVENLTGGNAGLFPAQFRLHDEKGFEYERGLPLKQPSLEWRTMGNRETIRGYIDFVVPKSAKGLKLVYSHLPAAGSKPIHVELGE